MTVVLPDPWADVSAARLPVTALPCLAAVRDRSNVRVQFLGEFAWVTWPSGGVDVVVCLLPVAGVEFFVRRGDEWFRFNSRVPTSERPPDGAGRAIDAVLIPERLEARPPDTTPLRKIAVRVVRGGGLRSPTALRCALGELLHWVETATSFELSTLTAARTGGIVFLRGETLPVIPGAARYWGAEVHVPLGFRPDPELAPEVLRAVAGANPGDVVVMDDTGVVVIPGSAFAPLTRAGVRLAAQAASGSPR